MSKTPELIKAWRKLDVHNRPFVLEQDRKAFRGILDSKDGYHRIMNHSEFSKSNLCQNPSDATRFHLNLFPCPYLGNIRKAKVYILTLNPGFGFADYFVTANPEFREYQINQLRQTKRNGQFPWIDPELCWGGGFPYWFSRIKSVVSRIQELDKCSFRKALSIVSKNVATLELVPYHSSSYKLSKKVFNQMESPKLMLDFVHANIVPRAKDGDALIICARQVKEWGLEKRRKNVITFKGHETRRANLTKYTNRIVKMIRG